MRPSARSLLLIAVLSATCALAPHAQAQVSTNPPASNSATSIFNSAEEFFTSFGPYSFAGTHGWFESGVALQNNINVGATLELGAPIWHTGTNSAITLASETLNAGIAGTIVQEQIDLGWAIDVHDVQIVLGLGGGYDFQHKQLFPDVYAELQKKLTANTHAFLRVEEPILGKNATAPLVSAGVGFTF